MFEITGCFSPDLNTCVNSANLKWSGHIPHSKLYAPTISGAIVFNVFNEYH